MTDWWETVEADSSHPSYRDGRFQRKLVCLRIIERFELGVFRARTPKAKPRIQKFIERLLVLLLSGGRSLNLYAKQLIAGRPLDLADKKGFQYQES
jgi:hypothetical protein